jgi:hypothetical protein
MSCETFGSRSARAHPRDRTKAIDASDRYLAGEAQPRLGLIGLARWSTPRSCLATSSATSSAQANQPHRRRPQGATGGSAYRGIDSPSS